MTPFFIDANISQPQYNDNNSAFLIFPFGGRMTRNNGGPKDIGRREFLKKAGAVVIVGAAAGLAACTPTTRREEIAVAASLLGHDPDKCAGCGTCLLMCSLLHEGESGPALSRSELVRFPFDSTSVFYACQQCRSPNCYYACPRKDSARCIDEITGIVYVDASKCIGCGKCVKACPFEPKRTKLHPITKKSIKCDLCRGREDGPMCVQYCGMRALSIINGAERG